MLEVGSRPTSSSQTLLLLLQATVPSGSNSVIHQLLHDPAVDDPPDLSTHHRGISANTPHPMYSRV